MHIKTHRPLHPLTVIVTRPHHQAASLCQSIEKLGAKTVSIPSIEIESLSIEQHRQSISQQIKASDFAIFLSSNAVLHSHQFWKSMPVLPRLIPIGPGTAQTLQSLNLPLYTIPTTYSSEGLLELDVLRNLAEKTVYLCSGEHSRPLLAEGLRQRQARVINLLCYRRHCPRLDKEALQQLHAAPPTISITTSRECLLNFHQIIANANISWLLNQPLLVAHATHKPLAKQLGFKHIFTAPNPTDVAIISSLIEHKDQFVV